MRTTDKIVDDLNSYSPKQDEWGDLDVLIEEASEHSGEKIIKALLNILER